MCRRAAQARPLTKAWPARSGFGPRTCHERRVTEVTKLAFVWLASGARVSDDRQTTNRRMPDGIIVCFSFVSSGVHLAGTNSRRWPRRWSRNWTALGRHGHRAGSVAYGCAPLRSTAADRDPNVNLSLSEAVECAADTAGPANLSSGRNAAAAARCLEVRVSHTLWPLSSEARCRLMKPKRHRTNPNGTKSFGCCWSVRPANERRMFSDFRPTE